MILKFPTLRPYSVSTPIVATTSSAGTPNSRLARSSADAFSIQKRTPFSMRVGSTMRLRYSNHGRDMPVPGADIARIIEGRLCTC
jgi:hypothetical protein